MKIMSLNVKRFEAEHIMSGGWTMSILRIAREFLDRHSDGVVFLYEVPREFHRESIKRVMSPYQVECSGYSGDHIYTVAIRSERIKNRGWNAVEENGFIVGYSGKKKDYANRYVELINEQGIRLLGVHAPLIQKRDRNQDHWEMIKGKKEYEKVYKPVKEFFDKLKEYAERHKKEKFIILGDLNVHSEEGCYYLNKYEEIKEMQYFDAIPDGTVTHFPYGKTLDHVLVSHELEGKVTARVEQDIILSDHAVIIVDIKE